MAHCGISCTAMLGAARCPQLRAASVVRCRGAKCRRGPVRCAASVAHDTQLGEVQRTAIAESRTLLEWPQICQQVACFCTTIMGSTQVLQHGLPEAGDLHACEELMQQTAEAMTADLKFPGAFDLRPALEAVQNPGFTLNGQQLQGVRSTLEAAFSAQERLQRPAVGSASGGPAFPALARLADGIDPEDRSLLSVLQQCIQLGEVTDAASDRLAQLRQQRRENLGQLRRAVEVAAAAMKAVGASEGTTSIVRDRFCVAVKAGRQGELGKGAMRLGASSSGATLYVEPPAAVALNNTEALLRDAVGEEEAAVLAMLTHMVRERSQSLEALVDSLAALDVAAGRAAHARWLGALRPALRRSPASPSTPSTPPTSPPSSSSPALRASSSSGPDSDGTCLVHAPGARHPLLMQPALPPLPYPPSAADFRFDRNFQEAPAWEQTPRSGPPRGGPTKDGQLPRPLDLRIPPAKKVVAITGPNTGGKTATLKTLGVLVLMAKAGLFWPCDEEAVQQYGPPHCAYFDRVLADLGDSQSLQQNLSTFSGHIRRVKQILAAATPQSLALLDEVGSGTDPAEGAALARSVLDTLKDRAALAVATTHHAELRDVASEDPMYCNVSMEFDAVSLRPTYRLLWGEAGASSALDIALTLGFDSRVVAEARRVVAQGRGALAVGGSTEEVVARLKNQLAATKVAADVAREAGQAVRRRVSTLKAELQQLQQEQDKLKKWEQGVKQEKVRITRELDTAVQQYTAGIITQKQVEEVFRRSNQEVLKML